MAFSVESLTVPPDSGYPLYVMAKRYLPDRRLSSNPECSGLTLIFFHATSFHKEMWEPCLEVLFSLTDQYEVEEAWAIESPNHGESAVINAQALQRPPFSEEFGNLGYAKAAQRFLAHRLEFRRDRRRKLVAIGHSAGANAAVILRSLTPALPFLSVIVVEPMISPGNDGSLETLRYRLLHVVKKRRDTWASREEARKSLPWKGKELGGSCWHPKIIESYIQHAVVPAQDADGKIYITLACTRKQEEIMYLDDEGPNLTMDALDHISSMTPLHLVLGVVKDFISADIHATLTSSPFANGRKWTSVTTVPGVGHLIPQEQPEALAKVLSELLTTMAPSRTRCQPKL